MVDVNVLERALSECWAAEVSGVSYYEALGESGSPISPLVKFDVLVLVEKTTRDLNEAVARRYGVSIDQGEAELIGVEAAQLGNDWGEVLENALAYTPDTLRMFTNLADVLPEEEFAWGQAVVENERAQMVLFVCAATGRANDWSAIESPWVTWAPYLGKEVGVMPEERIPGRPSTRRYTPAEREQAVRLVRQLRSEQGPTKEPLPRWLASSATGVESVRAWGEPGRRRRRGAPRDDHGGREIKETRAGGQRAQASQRDLEEGIRVFRPGGARPPTAVMVSFMRRAPGEFGVGPICRLRVAPSTPTAAKSRQPSPRGDPRHRAQADPLRALEHQPQGLRAPTSSGRRPGAPGTTSAGTRWPASCVNWAFAG